MFPSDLGSRRKGAFPSEWGFLKARLYLPSDSSSLMQGCVSPQTACPWKAALCLASDSVSLKAHSLLSLLKLRAVFGQSGLPEAGLFLISVSCCVAGLCLPPKLGLFESRTIFHDSWAP